MAKRPLYAKIAQSFSRAITSGAFLAGEKLPSLREVMDTRGVSQATAMRAMLELEAMGLVVARQRSGYVVSAPQSQNMVERFGAADEAAPSGPLNEPISVSVASLTQELFGAFDRSDLVALGAAVLDPALIPVGELNAASHKAERRFGSKMYKSIDIQGLIDLRHAVSRYLVGRGFEVSANKLIMTSGATDAIALALRTLTTPGGIVAVESPSYFGALRELELAGLQVVEIATDRKHGLDVADLQRVASRFKLQAVVVNPTFSNPTGSVMPEEAMRQMVWSMAKLGVPIIEDDVYGDLGFDGKVRPSLAALDASGNVFYCGSFAKTVSAGLRMGWCAPGRHFDAALEVQKARPVVTATPQQYTLLCYLDGRRHAQQAARLRSLFAKQRNDIRKAIIRCFPAGSVVSNPEGGFLYWVTVPPPFDAFIFYQQALKNGISVAPGPIFSANGKFRDSVRLSFGSKISRRTMLAVEKLGELACQGNVSDIGG